MTNCTCWRKRSAHHINGDPAPNTIEALQDAWQRDQELIFEQRDEIARLKGKLNQARQKISPA